MIEYDPVQTPDNTKLYLKKPWERHRQIAPVGKESCTDTSFGNDTDVNKIVARFHRTGELPKPGVEPKYADVTNLQEDLTTLLEKTANAREQLAQLQKDQLKQKEEQALKDAQDLAAYRAKEQESAKAGAESDT